MYELIYTDVTKSGWVRDEGFAEHIAEFEKDVPPLRQFSDSERPELLDSSKWLRIENQRNQGSCRGHSLSTLLELGYYIETGGVIQFSRQFAYRQTQIHDGIRGDRGSTIAGGVKTAVQQGLPREEFWPYPNGYQVDPPRGWEICREDAANYKTTGARTLKTYQEVLDALASREGGVDFGAMWFDSIDEQVARNEGVLERWQAPRTSVGGHAFAGIGYRPTHPNGTRKLLDSQGRPYIEIYNSWDTRWGFNGRAWFAPTAVEEMLRHQWTECVQHYRLKLGQKAVWPKWN